MDNFVVAIDGPAGSGKSSISKEVALKLGFTHIDTGAMYRAVTLEALRLKIDIYNEEEYKFLNDINVKYVDNKIFLNDEDVSNLIRSEEVTNSVSQVSKIPSVRNKMVEFQRESAKHGFVIMDGRDIGTVVVPDAGLKIFLTASAKERARRRCLDNEKLGIEANYEIILEEIKKRDYKDSHREIAPLKKASDAILVDTTNMSFQDVCDKIINLIIKRKKEMEEKNTMENFEMKVLKPRDVVKGTVVSIKDDKTAYIGIDGCFTEGTIHLDHFTKDSTVESFKDIVKVGDVIEAEVMKVSEESIFLSRLNLLKDENFKKLNEKKENKDNIEVLVKSAVADKGYNCLYQGITLFMPKSQATAEVLVNKTVLARIIELDEAKHRGVISARVIAQEELQQNRDNEYASINVDDVLTGTVARVEKYGAIVKFNYVQGLLKTNQVSHSFIDINNELHVGDTIEVKVISKNNNKLELSRKALLKTPFNLYIDEHKVSDKVSGKVVNKLAFGLLLELAPEVKGLLHNSEYSHNPNDNFQASVKIGDILEVAIIGINEEKEKISLSRKALMDNPWERVTAKVGDLLDVKVSEVKESGLVVEACGVDGFVPSSEALLERKNDLSSYYAVGDEAKAYVIEVNPKEWKLKLSIKKYLNEEERKSFEKYLNEEDKPTTLGDVFKDSLK